MTFALTGRRVGAAVIVCGVLAAGCSRSDDADSSATTAVAPATTASPATTAAPATSAAPVTTAGSGTTAAPTTAAPTTAAETTTTVAAPGPGDFGDLQAVCGPGDASGSTEQGVTDSKIVVGTMSDPGNTFIPGLNQELFDAADTFVGWCNEAGGILGRTLELNKHDAKLFEAAPATVAACQTDFMLVGNGVAIDDTTVEPRLGCGLAQISAFTVSPAAGRAEGSIEAITNSDFMSHLTGIYRALVDEDPDVMPFYGMLNNQLPSLNPNGQRALAAAKDLGFTQVYYDELPTGVDNWRPFAENIKAAGVQVLSMVSTPENTAALLRAMDDVGYFPKYLVMEGNFYNPKLVIEAADALGKTTVLINQYLVPFELADEYPATKKFIELLDQYTGQPPRALAVNAFSAWLLWAQAATACGSELTRACVMEKASTTTGWTAGGLHAADNPSNTGGKNSECFLAMQATPDGFLVNDQFTRANQGLYNCDPENSVQVSGFEP